jgi:hypothetical protein
MSGERGPLDRARFQLEFMALMLQSGRGEDAAEAYNRVREYLAEAQREMDRLRDVAPDPSPLLAVLRH